jgi:PAS domain S-box-containing protein
MTQPISRGEAEVLELFQDSVFIRDMQGRILFWNEASQALYEWSSEQALGLDAPTLLKCEYLAGDEAAHSQLMAEGQWQGELYRTTASGTRRLVSVSCSLRRDAQGNPVGILDTAHDISAAKETERQLKDSEYRYRNLFQAMAASFWELDFTRVGPRLRALLDAKVGDLETYFLEHPEVVMELLHETWVIDVNDHSIRLFGRGDREEMLGPVDRYWPAASIQVYARCVVKSLAREPNNIEVTRLKTLDGRELDCLFTACFSRENIARGVILIGIIDLSEQVAARHALEIMQNELAHAARISILGELTASIAHEVNQPMSAIATYAEAALRWLNRPEPDLREVELALRQIVNDTRRATDVIARIRSMALRSPTQEVTLALNDVIRESLQFIRNELKTHAVHLILDLDPARPHIRADRVLIQQVLVNLTMNAVQAMAGSDAPEARLWVRSRLVAGDMVQVQVIDNGPGIANDHLEKLFDSFFTTKPTGMGMGLPICRSIIEGAGGSITMGNRDDGQSGAKITLGFPALHIVTSTAG